MFPNAARPTFGVFVENQILRLAARSDVELRVVNPIIVPHFPLDLHSRYRSLRTLPREETWKGVRIARPRLRVIPGVSGTFNPMLLYRAAKPVLRRWWAEGFRFDLVDAQYFYPDGPAAARLAKEFGVPFSIKARGDDIGYWGTRPGCRRQILDAAAQAGGLLAVAQSMRQDMVAMGMDGSKITVHYTGTDLGKFRPQDRPAAKAALGVSGPLVVSLGSLIPRKGHDFVIRAIASVEGATLLVVGEGPEHAALEALAKSLGISDRVRLLGSLPHGHLPAILGAADVMALASGSEGLANAWVEAMACGTPVVIPDVDGAAEAVDRPAAGRLVPDRTPSAIADAIRAILADPPAPQDVRASAERFTWQRNTDALRTHLEAVKRHGGSATRHAVGGCGPGPGDRHLAHRPAAAGQGQAEEPDRGGAALRPAIDV